MAAELYLVAHRVRGEPAFDIAQQISCSICGGAGKDTIADSIEEIECIECDAIGFWWIIPTSGHRAYPYHYWPWDELACDSRISEHEFDPIPIQLGTMPPDLQDHYHLNQPAAPNQPSLLSRLNLKPTPQPPIVRRI